jgi:hypothetical protein
VRQQCIEQHKKDAEAKANAKSAKHAAAMAAMVTNYLEWNFGFNRLSSAK